MYGLLSVDEKQLSPASVELTVHEGGMFSVTKVNLKANDVMDPPIDWISKMHTTVVDDIDYVHKNPLYNNSCSDDGGCPYRHWSCPYVLTSLFGGSHVARRTNRHIYLITPGIFHIVCYCTPFFYHVKYARYSYRVLILRCW